MTVIIDSHHVETVCQPGKPACCRYLVVGSGGFECAKHTSLRALLDSRVAAGTMRAVGDNCKGVMPMLQERGQPS